MLLDLDTLDDVNDPRLHCDVCVVGGGAIGIALATSLADAGVRVLLLEGGGGRLESASQALQQGRSVGHPFANVDVGRYRVLGGTTTYWGGQVVPFDAFVTGPRPWAGHAAWPVPADELQRWFALTYQQLGLGQAVLDDAQVWAAAGLPQPALGPELDVVTTRWVKTRNFAKLFGASLRRPAGLQVLTHANVTALRMDAARQRVASVLVRSLSGRSLEVRANRFVLANGTLEIARLLLHPLADGSSAPWCDNAWIGAPFIDHLDCVAADVQVLDHERFHDLFDNVFVGGHRYYPKLRMAPATQQREGLVDVAGSFLYRTRFTEHLDYLKLFLRSIREGSEGVRFAELPRHVGALAATAWPLAKRYFRDRRSFKPRDAEVSLALHTEQLPNLRSRIALGEECDALGMHRLTVDWQIDGRELQAMRRFTQLVGERLQDKGLARVVMDPALAAGDPAFANRIHDSVHQMGSTRMGSNRQQGAVDADLKLFDTDNLYVAGAAVFPSTGFANPTFTALALARRLSQHLAAAPKP